MPEVAEEMGPAGGELHVEGWDGHVVAEHALLLRRAGFLEAGFTMGSPVHVHVSGLSWAGYDLLDGSVWASVKEQASGVPQLALTLND